MSKAFKMVCGQLIGTVWYKICCLHVLYFANDEESVIWWAEHRFDYDISPPPIPGRLM